MNAERRNNRAYSRAARELPGRQVARAYVLILGRHPDKEGLDYWTNWLAAERRRGEHPAAPIEKFLGQILSSRERVESMPLKRLRQHLAESLKGAKGLHLASYLGDLDRPIHPVALQGPLGRLLIDPAVVKATKAEVDEVVRMRTRVRG